MIGWGRVGGELAVVRCRFSGIYLRRFCVGCYLIDCNNNIVPPLPYFDTVPLEYYCRVWIPFVK